MQWLLMKNEENEVTGIANTQQITAIYGGMIHFKNNMAIQISENIEVVDSLESLDMSKLFIGEEQ